MLPTHALERLIMGRAAYLLDSPFVHMGIGKGLTRSIHTLAFIERIYGAYFENDVHDGTPGFFSRETRDCIAERLKSTHVQPEESRFRDILDWRTADKKKLREEFRSNFERLFRPWPEPYGYVGIELHLLFDLRMRFNALGYLSAVDESDYRAQLRLLTMQERFIDQVPGLRAIA